MGTELWTRQEVAEYLGIAASSVNKRLTRLGVTRDHQRVVRGRAVNYYRADEVRAAAAAAPGRAWRRGKTEPGLERRDDTGRSE